MSEWRLGFYCFDQTYQQLSLIRKGFSVKYTGNLPKIVQNVLPGKAALAVSKYVLAYEKSQYYLNGLNTGKMGIYK